MDANPDLAHRSFNYSPVGVTSIAGEHPNAAEVGAGYHRYERTVRIGEGPDFWEFAAAEVLRWGIKTRSGFVVRPEKAEESARNLVAGHDYWLIAKIGPLRVCEPARVVDVVDEGDRKGFAYGTLTGHPLRGEEAFMISRTADSGVWFTLRSVSKCAPSGIWRWAYPAVMVAQRYCRRRYLRALAAESSQRRMREAPNSSLSAEIASEGESNSPNGV